MTRDEAIITSELQNALRALNTAADKAWKADLEVSVGYDTMQEIDKRLPRRVYFAEISKQEFNKRV